MLAASCFPVMRAEDIYVCVIINRRRLQLRSVWQEEASFILRKASALVEQDLENGQIQPIIR